MAGVREAGNGQTYLTRHWASSGLATDLGKPRNLTKRAYKDQGLIEKVGPPDRRSSDSRRTYKVGGHRVQQATARHRDSSLEKRKAPSNSAPNASGSTHA